MPTIAVTSTGLTDAEIEELEQFLLYECESTDGMTIDMLDGYLHAIAVGPTTIFPARWLPAVWGEGGRTLPHTVTASEAERIVSLIFRRYNEVIENFNAAEPSLAPIWSSRDFRGKTYEDGELWAHGFCAGMKLCWKDWQPLLATPKGDAWFRPIGLLGMQDFGPEQDALTETPADREALSRQIPNAVFAMSQYWRPYRRAVEERRIAKTYVGKVGRNEPCPCGSGKKFKKCCGAAADLH